ncbi:MAG: diguanylate cyclase domain-containing protein [Thermoanaerobaculia bacterium]
MSNPQPANDVQAASALTDVLGKSEEVRDLVVEAAEELSSVNSALKHELAEQGPRPGVEAALEKSEVVEARVHDASAKLERVNSALESEVRERDALESRLAAASEQGVAARHAALHDVLTGLPNRALFCDRLEHGIAQVARHFRPLAVIFVDLDEFKLINDTHGHDAGDNVLRTIASRLRASTRSDDTVCRFGGDEFLYLLMEVPDEADVALIAKKIIAAIEAPCDLPNAQPSLSVGVKASLGIAIYPRDGVTADALIKRADKAMYRAKEMGSGFAFAS